MIFKKYFITLFCLKLYPKYKIKVIYLINFFNYCRKEISFKNVISI